MWRFSAIVSGWLFRQAFRKWLFIRIANSWLERTSLWEEANHDSAQSDIIRLLRKAKPHIIELVAGLAYAFAFGLSSGLPFHVIFADAAA